jgi:hypothetical protein
MQSSELPGAWISLSGIGQELCLTIPTFQTVAYHPTITLNKKSPDGQIRAF